MGLTTTVTGPVTKLCPYKDERDHGTVTLVFDGGAPELHDLAHVLAEWADTPGTHEDFTKAISIRYPDAHVTSTWATAGLTVTCAVPREPVDPDDS